MFGHLIVFPAVGHSVLDLIAEVVFQRQSMILFFTTWGNILSDKNKMLCRMMRIQRHLVAW